MIGACATLALSAVAAVAPDPVLGVRCEPAVVERGQPVRCSAELDRPLPFLLLERSAETEGLPLVENFSQPKSAGATVEWSGVALLDTRVTFKVRVLAAGRPTVSGTAAFSVSPRRWPAIDAARCDAWEVDRRQPPSSGASASADPPLRTLGRPAHVSAALKLPRWSLLNAGPNAGWYFLQAPLRELRRTLRLSPALLEGSGFYQAQYADLSVPVAAAWPSCRKQDVADLRERLLRCLAHQGGAETDVQQLAEGLHLQLASLKGGMTFAQAVTETLQAFLGQASAPGLRVALPCQPRSP